MRKICLISDHHICTNPRLLKEALALSKAGYEVVALTIFTSVQQFERDQNLLKAIKGVTYKPVLNLIETESPFLLRFYYRLRKKIVSYLKIYFGFESPLLLGYAPELLLEASLKEEADLYIVHIDCAQYVGTKLAEKGKRVGFDFEDWYSHDYINKLRPVKFLEKIEKYALNNSAFCLTPSNAMADAIKDYYTATARPVVIYNGFPKVEVDLESKHSNSVSIIWFSQTIGTDRGIETVFQALKVVDFPISLKLIGDHDESLKNEFESLFPFSKGHQLIWSQQIPADQLQQEIAKHTIGLALEREMPESRNTTVTNKILQYLQSGIQVIATKTLGQLEVAEKMEGAVHVVGFDSPNEIAEAIHQIRINAKDAKQIIDNYDKFFSWESQEGKLIDTVRNALK